MIDNHVDPTWQPRIEVSERGSVLVVWRSASTIRTPHAFALREDRSWQEVRRFDATGTERYPAIAMDANGNALLVWGREEPSFGLVRSNRYYAGVGWEHSTHRVLYTGESSESAPHVSAAMSPSGDALVAYVVRSPNGMNRVYAHTLR